MKQWLLGLALVSKAAFAGNFGGNGTGGIQVGTGSGGILIYDFWEAENRQFIHGSEFSYNLVIDRNAGSSERARAKLRGTLPTLSKQAEYCMERMNSEQLPPSMVLSPPEDIDTTFLPENGRLIRIATWSKARNRIVFDTHAPMPWLDHPEGQSVIRLHEAIYYIWRIFAANSQPPVDLLNSLWARRVTSCLYAENCTEAEFKKLAGRIDEWLRRLGGLACDYSDRSLDN